MWSEKLEAFVNSLKWSFGKLTDGLPTTKRPKQL